MDTRLSSYYQTKIKAPSKLLKMGLENFKLAAI